MSKTSEQLQVNRALIVRYTELMNIMAEEMNVLAEDQQNKDAFQRYQTAYREAHQINEGLQQIGLAMNYLRVDTYLKDEPNGSEWCIHAVPPLSIEERNNANHTD